MHDVPLCERPAYRKQKAMLRVEKAKPPAQKGRHLPQGDAPMIARKGERAGFA
jgi:hypothetical protein